MTNSASAAAFSSLLIVIFERRLESYLAAMKAAGVSTATVRYRFRNMIPLDQKRVEPLRAANRDPASVGLRAPPFIDPEGLQSAALGRLLIHYQNFPEFAGIPIREGALAVKSVLLEEIVERYRRIKACDADFLEGIRWILVRHDQREPPVLSCPAEISEARSNAQYRIFHVGAS